MFGSLASDASAFLPYDRGIADQRRKYGESILRRADEHLASQETYEQEVQQKLEAARRRRMDEKERLEAIEVMFHY
jgi:RNA polymerase-associated protein CTR9